MVPERRNQELPPCWTQAFPARSEMELLLAKVEPSSDTGGIFVIAYLRKFRKHRIATVREK